MSSTAASRQSPSRRGRGFFFLPGIYALLYLDDRPALLAATTLLLGWPLTSAALALAFSAISRTIRRA